jgi:hypothetical protein
LPEEQANRFIKYYGTPMWADLESKNKRKKLKRAKRVRLLNADEEEVAEEAESDDSEVDENFFQQTGNFLIDSGRVTSATSSLPKTNLEIKVCTDANKEDPDKARLKCVEFHPSARVMLTGGLDQKLSLFQVRISFALQILKIANTKRC